MNFSETTPAQIYEWIKKRDNGDSTDYYKVKDDTQEAIDVLKSLYGCTFVSPYKLFHYLYNHLCMRVEKTQSFYRAFIVLKNDDIITLRLSQHFSTRNSVKKAIKDFGKADVEYHLIIGRTQSVNPKKDIYYDRNLKFVSFKIRDIDLADFNDNGKRRGILDEIIKLLTDGNSPSSDNNESINRNMKKTIRLTESALRGMIKEAVKKILRENRQMIREFNDEVGNEDTFETDEERVVAKISQILLPIGSIRKGFKSCTVQQVIDVMERGGWKYLNTDEDKDGDYEIYFTDGDDKVVIYYNNFYLKIQNIHSA